MSYICELFFIVSLAFIVINLKTSFLEYLLLFWDDTVDEESE